MGGFALLNCEVLKVIPKAALEADAAARHGPDNEPKALTAEPMEDKPRLPDAALRAWYEAFKIAYPKGSQMLAEKSAAAAFPAHHVARNRIRELFPNSPRGRPRKNNDLDNSPESDGE